MLGLVPRQGHGIVRRAILLALVSWLPVAVWAWMRGRALPGQLAEPLLAHYGVHVRCLIAIPLFIIAEGTVHAATRRLVGQLVERGILLDTPELKAAVDRIIRLRALAAPWVVLIAITLALSIAPGQHQPHDLIWATDAPDGVTFGFGGWWYRYVARTLYIALGLAWLWRLFLLAVLLHKISKLDLSLVPTHPDRFAGLEPLSRLPGAFAPVILGLSSVLASGWAHGVVYHDTQLPALRVPAALFVVLATLLFISPVLVFTPMLMKTRRAALNQYGALVARHGRGVRERWIEGRPVEDDVLSAPEVGPVADTISMYDAITRIQPLLVSKGALIAVIAASILPMLVVISLRIPLPELIKTLLKALT